jgi:hypothetical protein
MDCQHLHDLPNLQFMPVRSNKLPIIKGWQDSELKHSLKNCEAVGLVCGPLSGGLEIIDVDCKYDLTGKLFENYKRLIHEIDPNLLKKLVIEKTRGGGYHVIYRCSKIEGNQKFANRPTTKEEKDQTYSETYKAELKKSTDDATARATAEKASKNDKVRVLLESRGEGGYIMCYPTPGYELIYGDYYSISEITPEERDVLHGVARQFNQVLNEAVPPKTGRVKKGEGLSPFDDYNQRGDVVALLAEHGWKVVGQKGAKTVFLRPGQTTSQSSGNYDSEKNWFSVFTTSTEFDPQTAYLPYAVFAKLECNNDFSEAAKRLREMGYGEKDEPKEKAPSTRVIQSRVNPEEPNAESFFATRDDSSQYLQSVRDGTLVMGKTTGMPSLDKNFLFKDGTLVMTNGIDNVGKTEMGWWFNLIAAMYHGWKGVIFSSENTIGAFMRRMIQFYWGKPLSGQYAMNQKEFEVARGFVEKHFLIIKAQEDLYNYKDIINLCRIALSKGKYHYGMIDPYNSLKTDLSGFSKLSTHDYHYEALSEIKSFGQQNNFGWFVHNHAVTSALRMKDADKKYPVAPRKEDTEGGGKFANKADDFITFHRITQHPTDWMITEIHVRKIKDTETGGRPTGIDFPIKLERYGGGYAYREFDDATRSPGIDPIAEWHRKQNDWVQKPIEIPERIRQSWTPYKNEDNDTEISF